MMPTVDDAIEMERLARPCTGAEYDPTIVVNNDFCWPSEPILERLDSDGHHDARHAEDAYHRGRALTPVRVQRRRTGGPTEGATFDPFGLFS